MKLIKKIFGHLKTVNHHKWLVFKLSILAGIPIQGLFHDLSKYSPEEFFESVKYYSDGKYSPYSKEKSEKGYAPGWLHHKGRNKHHHEYWYDYGSIEKSAPMPFKYFIEMVCDNIAAGMNYRGKDFDLKCPLEYFESRTSTLPINKGILNALKDVYIELPIKGLKSTLKKSNLRIIYDKNIK